MTIRAMATTRAMMIMVKDDVASDDAVIDDDDGEHTLQQLHFRECPRYATASQAAWPPLTETATECSHYTINHDEEGNDENISIRRDSKFRLTGLVFLGVTVTLKALGDNILD